MTVPALYEIQLDSKAEPLLVTNMRNTFVLTRRSKEGIGRYGFSEVPLDEEGALIAELHRILVKTSRDKGWTNRCRTAAEGIARMRSFGLEPKYVVVSSADVCESKDDKAAYDKIDLAKGHVTEIDGIHVLVAELPKGQALVTTLPNLTGVYTRVGTHVGVMIQRADQSVVVVGDDVV